MAESCRDPRCCRCGVPLTRDEIGLTKKLINRGTADFLCYGCMAAHFRVTADALKEKVRQFREMGCTLFDGK